MNRYKLEVIEQVIYCVTVEAKTKQEALEAAQRHDGESVQISAPEYIFGAPVRIEGD